MHANTSWMHTPTHTCRQEGKSHHTILDTELLMRKLLGGLRQPALVTLNTPPTGLFAHRPPQNIPLYLHPMHFSESNED